VIPHILIITHPNRNIGSLFNFRAWWWWDQQNKRWLLGGSVWTISQFSRETIEQCIQKHFYWNKHRDSEKRILSSFGWWHMLCGVCVNVWYETGENKDAKKNRTLWIAVHAAVHSSTDWVSATVSSTDHALARLSLRFGKCHFQMASHPTKTDLNPSMNSSLPSVLLPAPGWTFSGYDSHCAGFQGT